MAGRKQRGLDRLEFEEIISQARDRWLRPAEIFDILRNPARLGLSDKPANLPASGSLFLYDRNVLRHFRNDGHRWKKTKKRKAVKEGHERLKVEGDEVLHCYYAHGEENENFQRRSYWRIEQDLSHIVLVHYREVKSNRKKVQARDTTILNTAQASELDTAFTFASAGATLTTAVGGGEDVKNDIETAKVVEAQESGGGSKKNSEVGSSSNSKNIEEGNIVKPHEVGSGGGGKLKEAQTGNLLGTESANNHQASVRLQPFLEVQQPEKSNAELNNWMSESLEALDETKMQSSTGADLNTFESENEIDKSSAPMHVRSDSSMLGTFAPHDQLFSIINISPDWIYENSESTVVVIKGRFLKNEQAKSCKWSCMFGEVEVDAEVIGDGVLRCHAPQQKAGRHPFYVTCSNRMSCSEVREFEYRRIGGGIGGGGSVVFGKPGPRDFYGRFQRLDLGSNHLGCCTPLPSLSR